MMKTMGILAMAALLAAPAMAGYSMQDTFVSSGSGTVTVESMVTQIGNEYKYSYTILPSSTLNVQWFSVQILPGASVTSWGVEPGMGQPFVWVPIGGANPISIDAIFTAPIAAGTKSATLWFKSTQNYTTANGATGGLNGGPYVTTTGTVLTPVPEPATLSLLGAGLAMLSARRKK